MKIGIDLDGVVIDSQSTCRTYGEIYDIDYLKRNSLIDREEPDFQQRYNWAKEEQEDFVKKFILKTSTESGLIGGFKSVYNLLKKENIEFIVITARGSFIKEMKEDAIRILEENDIQFDKYYWTIRDKVEVCKNEKIDLMIDDNYRNIEELANNGIKTLYLRATDLKRLPENEYIKEVHNWGDIYRYIKERLNESSNS